MATAGGKHGDRRWETWRPQVGNMATAGGKHGDREGRHYYTTALQAASLIYIVVATLAVAMFHLNQYPSDADQRHHHANDGRHRGYFSKQENTQDDTPGYFLRGEQVGVGGVDAAHGGVVEGVSESEREDAQRDDRADCSQRVGVREGEEERGGQEPERGQAIDVGGVAKEWVAVALAASRYRIDG